MSETVAQVSPKQRLAGLDALRGLAALAVMVYHYTGTKAGHAGSHESRQLVHLQYGVHLFFAISGFVIFLTLEKSRSWSDFVISRFARLYPPFWVCLALTWLVVLAFGLPGRETSVRDLAWNVTMVPTLLNLTLFRGGDPVAPVDGVYWSLQVELMFYAWSLVAWWLVGSRRMVWVATAWCALAAASAWWPPGMLAKSISFVGLLEWAPFFSIGILAHELGSRGVSSGSLGLLASLTAALVAGAPLALGVGVAVAVLFWVFMRIKHPPAALHGLVWVGLVSYPLYLTHQNIGYISIRQLSHAGVPYFWSLALVSAGALLLAGILHYVAEMPLTRLCRQSLVGLRDRLNARQ